MISLGTISEEKKLDVLCLGAHCDDIEIGCGGTLLKWIDGNRVRKVVWVVFSSDNKRADEAKKSADKYLEKIADREIIIFDFKDAFLNFYAGQVKECFESLKQKIEPGLIFSHYRQDRHQDHRLLSDLTYNTFRNHLILEYEIPKYDGDLGNPNTYIEISRENVLRKASLLLECFPSQKGKHWFDEETFSALMRIRGLECNSGSRYAEAFFMRKCLIK
ncbi:MAG: PIG-L family deacetylase [Saprospiraceae bacterium]|nr:PIG-L family deacetylase [Saprospiraceae bacterium]